MTGEAIRAAVALLPELKERADRPIKSDDLYCVTPSELETIIAALEAAKELEEHMAGMREFHETYAGLAKCEIAQLREQVIALSGDRVVVPREVIRFLNGEGPLDGYWFGEKPFPDAPFWWRRYLSAAPLASAHGDEGMVEDGGELMERIARAICRENCACIGERACFEVEGSWPNSDCGPPNCHSLAKAAINAITGKAWKHVA